MMLAKVTAFLAMHFLSAASVTAEVATVKGGEHADFTRLVVESASSAGWTFGRTEDGYELNLGDSVTAIDLTKSFDKIPRDRVKALWRDPANGRLRFSLACTCYAIAFEFRPGTVVIDIKFGLPPQGSSFESPIDSVQETNVATPASPGGEASYNWMAAKRDVSTRSYPDFSLMGEPGDYVSLDPLRDALLLQISKGVAEGVVEIGNLDVRSDGVAERVSEGPWSRVGIGEMPGLRAGSDRDLFGAMAADGADCPPDDQLDVAAWSLAGPISVQVGLGRSGLLAEFDAPVAPAIRRAARFHIFLGFGAEARQILELLGTSDDAVNILFAMSDIVDGDSPSPNPFENKESCDSAAALWAVLALPVDAAVPLQVNAKAVARGFSSLPPHLRQHLGGALVDRFSGIGDEKTARTLRDAILRTATDSNADANLMDARFHLAQGDDANASRLAEGVLEASGPTSAEAAITIVEAAFRGGRRIDSVLPETIDSFLLDARGTSLEPQLLRASVLSAALAGDFPAAFEKLDQTPETFRDLWSIAGEAMSDDLFLIEAARHLTTLPTAERSIRQITANRLMDLGFPDLALGWLSPEPLTQDPDGRLLAARAYMAMRDPRTALDLVAGLDSKDAVMLRAAATTQLGDIKKAADLLFEIGESTLGQRQLAWTQDWTSIAEKGTSNWVDAALLLDGERVASTSGPIARGTALVQESAAARASIEALLVGISSTPLGQ